MTETRDQRIHKLITDGRATVIDILRADYGVWPPNGIDPVVEPKQKVKLLSMWNLSGHDEINKAWKKAVDQKTGSPDTYALTPNTERLIRAFCAIPLIIKTTLTKGVVTIPDGEGDHKIYLSFQSDSSTLGHEAVHIMQIDHAPEKLTIYSDYATKPSLLLESYWRTVKEGLPKSIRECWGTAACESCEKQSRCEKKFSGSISYFMKGHEIQARIHQCLVAGYPHWGRVPQNKEELWAALIACGVDAPEEIEELLQSTHEGKTALQDFIPLHDNSVVVGGVKNAGVSVGIGATALGSLFGAQALTGLPVFTAGEFFVVAGTLAAVALSSLDILVGACFGFRVVPEAQGLIIAQFYTHTDNHRFVFWNDVLPRVYGDLLEMYGDREGLARMGFGRNEALAGSWLNVLRENRGAYNERDFKRWADALDAGGRNKALLDILIPHPDREDLPNDKRLVQTLLEYRDIRNAFRSFALERGYAKADACAPN